MDKKLPTITIEGTEFFIDVVKEELIERANSQNRIRVKNMLYTGQGYHFHYDTVNRNLAAFGTAGDFTETKGVREITIPNLSDLDPDRMAQRYNQTIENIKGKTDFELAIKPGSLLDLRLNQRILPTVEIAGHSFFVDTAMDRLRPKDDFRSKGIPLEKISEYYDRTAHAYIIPYNPATHEFQEIDHLAITELPKEIIVVKFPHHQELDRVGWNVKYGFAPVHCIKEQDFQMHFKALTLPWQETNIPHSIKLNLEEKKLQKENQPAAEKMTERTLNAKKGRKI